MPDPPVDAQYLKDALGLKPLPEEGGFFVETYRADSRLSPACLGGDYDGERALSTAIYYLLTPDTFSAMHRLRSDEIFHFYLGDPVEMLQLHPNGRIEEIVLGNDIRARHRQQVLVPAGTWQGAVLVDGGSYALLGTTVAPAFEFADFELGDRAKLTSLYPAASKVIARLTR